MIEVTEAAVEYLNKVRGDDLVTLGVKGGGCSGFQYIFKFDSVKSHDDLVFEKNDVSVVIDEISLELLKGGTLDFTEELIGSYFQVINPNASSACGCGTSFSI